MVCGTTADCKGALFLHTEEPLKYTQGCWIKGKYVPNYLHNTFFQTFSLPDPVNRLH